MCTHTHTLSPSFLTGKESETMLIAFWWGSHVHSGRCRWIIDPNNVETSLQRGDTMDDFIRAPHNGGQISLYSMYKGYGNVPNESQFGRDELNGVPENGHDRRQQPHRHTQQYDTTESCRFLMFRNERGWKCAGIGLDFVQR